MADFGEDGTRTHLLLAASTTESGFKVRLWAESVVKLLTKEDNLQGPAICDESGYLVSTSEVDTEFHE